MFKRVAVPPFDLSFTVRGQGGFEVGTLTLVCKALRRKELDALLAQEDAQLTELLRAIVIGWNDSEEPFSVEALEDLMDQYPGIPQEFLKEYSRSMYMVQAKN